MGMVSGKGSRCVGESRSSKELLQSTDASVLAALERLRQEQRATNELLRQLLIPVTYISGCCSVLLLQLRQISASLGAVTHLLEDSIRSLSHLHLFARNLAAALAHTATLNAAQGLLAAHAAHASRGMTVSAAICMVACTTLALPYHWTACSSGAANPLPLSTSGASAATRRLLMGTHSRVSAAAAAGLGGYAAVLLGSRRRCGGGGRGVVGVTTSTVQHSASSPSVSIAGCAESSSAAAPGLEGSWWGWERLTVWAGQGWWWNGGSRSAEEVGCDVSSSVGGVGDWRGGLSPSGWVGWWTSGSGLGASAVGGVGDSGGGGGAGMLPRLFGAVHGLFSSSSRGGGAAVVTSSGGGGAAAAAAGGSGGWRHNAMTLRVLASWWAARWGFGGGLKSSGEVGSYGKYGALVEALGATTLVCRVALVGSFLLGALLLVLWLLGALLLPPRIRHFIWGSTEPETTSHPTAITNHRQPAISRTPSDEKSTALTSYAADSTPAIKPTVTPNAQSPCSSCARGTQVLVVATGTTTLQPSWASQSSSMETSGEDCGNGRRHPSRFGRLLPVSVLRPYGGLVYDMWARSGRLVALHSPVLTGALAAMRGSPVLWLVLQLVWHVVLPYAVMVHVQAPYDHTDEYDVDGGGAGGGGEEEDMCVENGKYGSGADDGNSKGGGGGDGSGDGSDAEGGGMKAEGSSNGSDMTAPGRVPRSPAKAAHKAPSSELPQPQQGESAGPGEDVVEDTAAAVSYPQHDGYDSTSCTTLHALQGHRQRGRVSSWMARVRGGPPVAAPSVPVAAGAAVGSVVSPSSGGSGLLQRSQPLRRPPSVAQHTPTLSPAESCNSGGSDNTQTSSAPTAPAPTGPAPTAATSIATATATITADNANHPSTFPTKESPTGTTTAITSPSTSRKHPGRPNITADVNDAAVDTAVEGVVVPSPSTTSLQRLLYTACYTLAAALRYISHPAWLLRVGGMLTSPPPPPTALTSALAATWLYIGPLVVGAAPAVPYLGSLLGGGAAVTVIVVAVSPIVMSVAARGFGGAMAATPGAVGSGVAADVGQRPGGQLHRHGGHRRMQSGVEGH